MPVQFNDKKAIQLTEAVTKISGAEGSVEKGKKAPKSVHDLVDALWAMFM